MKKIFKSIVVFSFFATLVSCSEDEKATVYGKVSPTLTADKTEISYRSNVTNATPVVMKFEWTEATYTGAKTSTYYTLEIPAKYPKNDIMRDTILFVETFNSNVTSYEIPGRLLRTELRRLEFIKAIKLSETNKIKFRLKSFVGTNGAVMYSNNFEITLNP